MSGLGISYLPPTENLPIFDSSVFPYTNNSSTATSDANKLDYPSAQGLETFPNGIKFADGTITTTAISRIPISISAPPFQTFPTSNINSQPQYNANQTLLIGATYFLSCAISLLGTNGANSGGGWSISLRGSIYSTQSSDWTFITSASSQQNITTATAYPNIFMNWSTIVYIDPAIYKIIPSNTTTDVWIQVDCNQFNIPTGSWSFSNILPSSFTFTRIA